MGKPIYVELAEILQQQISSGQYPVGSVLPPELVLCEMHGISRFTARAALATLQRQGYVIRKPRIGSLV
ncbi:MAG: winged helix-turn-helix domain-containing protein, partial [Gallionellaceae bacterium]|nr:winged helix-turn-helix domain-containing protein [Gallionellaceae bacterium]